jgi:hypothetical protein
MSEEAPVHQDRGFAQGCAAKFYGSERRPWTLFGGSIQILANHRGLIRLDVHSRAEVVVIRQAEPNLMFSWVKKKLLAGAIELVGMAHELSIHEDCRSVGSRLGL